MGSPYRHPLGAKAPMARRARRIREFHKLTPAAFSRKLGMARPSGWYNIEGGMTISVEMAYRLIDVTPGLTLDYILRGVVSGLPVGELSDFLRGA